VLVIEFRSFAHPAAIVGGAVLALAGSIGALFVTGTTLNLVSMMGMIMVVGIVSTNRHPDAGHGGGHPATGRT
jgi:multidrug efflux pump subunit AcrB